jgi:hypothetical protein
VRHRPNIFPIRPRESGGSHLDRFRGDLSAFGGSPRALGGCLEANDASEFHSPVGLGPASAAYWRNTGLRELRHSFVSLLSDAGVPVEMISQLVGHRGTSVTEVVYRHQIRPVIQTGATVMDELLRRASDAR